MERTGTVVRAITIWAIVLLLSGCIVKVRDDDDTATPADDDTADGPTVGVPDELPDAPLYEEYSERLLPVGYALPPLQWQFVGGALPEGLTMDVDGYVTGVPLEEGVFGLEVHVVDADGAAGQGTVALTVAVDPEALYLAVWVEDVDDLCPDQELLCVAWVRIEGTGEEQSERELFPALFHVGVDGNADAGYDDDVLYELLDPGVVAWSFTPYETLTDAGTYNVPADAEVLDGGVLLGGEMTGGGTVGIDHPVLGHGEADAFVVPPDWCPGWGC
jgi:hypothetical protein